MHDFNIMNLIPRYMYLLSELRRQLTSIRMNIMLTSQTGNEKTKSKVFRMTVDQSDLLERVFRNSIYKSTQELFEKEFIPVLELMESKQLSKR